MASFCKACSIENFGMDFHDFAGLVRIEQARAGFGVSVVCEGCGNTLVNHEGRCIADDCSLAGREGHGAPVLVRIPTSDDVDTE